jgi:hypothetical protein
MKNNNNKRLNNQTRLNISHCTDKNNTGLEKQQRTLTTNKIYVFEICRLVVIIYFSPVEKRKTIAVDKPTEKR